MTDDLKETLTDIARTASPQAPAGSPLDDAIEVAFNFYDHLNDPPDYAELPYDSQQKLLEGFVLEMPEADLGEITLLLDKYVTTKEVALLMTYSHTDAAPFDLIDLLSCYRVAVHEYARDSIDGRIADLFRDYCDSNGVYVSNGPDEPEELVGFQEMDDEIALLQNQAD